VKQLIQCGTSAGPLILREGGLLMIAGCQVNPVVLRIRDDGPAFGNDEPTFPLHNLATARLEPQA
jgi:hypothetical protein